VKIRQLDKAGATLSAAVDAGGNAARLFGVSFTIEDDSALLARLARRPSATQRRRRNSMGSRRDGRLVRWSASPRRFETLALTRLRSSSTRWPLPRPLSPSSRAGSGSLSPSPSSGRSASPLTHRRRLFGRGREQPLEGPELLE
jgi:hypothetical protein